MKAYSIKITGYSKRYPVTEEFQMKASALSTAVARSIKQFMSGELHKKQKRSIYQFVIICKKG